jgi:hypothetical protein
MIGNCRKAGEKRYWRSAIAGGWEKNVIGDRRLPEAGRKSLLAIGDCRRPGENRY